ncbi:MAG: UDP-N-acetylmuramoyl-L-alanyl-D-glutamate--2,6-diaminopimelate ligase [Anaerolineales bacterium]|nr:UDP-N-acetylmuramoyl-L-alanyl-D-glutamate--2,6-diaminopimelate ligase [Anaerolineales bacterium]
MRLSQLMSDVPHAVLPPEGDPEIAGVERDSRRISPGELFVACTGGTVDGHQFIRQAVAAGAAAVVGERGEEAAGVPFVRVPDSRRALGLISAAWFGNPSRKLVLIGVTGTDGKTTTVNLIFHILRRAGLRAGMITTVGAVIAGREVDTGFHVTTPEAPALQEYLARMADARLTHCVMEVTSHGLAQHRTAGCEFDIAAVTNITHEHLDYHGTFETYRAVKAGLFADLGAAPPKGGSPERLAVLNADDPSFDYLRGRTKARVFSYGRRAKADLTAADVRSDLEGLRMTVEAGGSTVPVRSGLHGVYNADNILAALAAASGGLGIGLEAAAAALAEAPGVPGRWEVIAEGQDFLAVVDFAHTPNSLRQVLGGARAAAPEGARVIAVFGAAGLRDREKRRQMAAAGIELADLTILTAEDPRTESLGEILEEMAAGARSRGGVEGVNFLRVPDRGRALREAVRAARKGDVVVACGKGHEQSMCFGEVEYPWDDRQAMRAVLAQLLGKPGPALPALPTSDSMKEES